jgi:hypothetical protein
MSTTSEELKDGVTRRDFLTLVGTAAAGITAVGPAFAQTPPAPSANPPDQSHRRARTAAKWRAADRN